MQRFDGDIVYQARFDAVDDSVGGGKGGYQRNLTHDGVGTNRLLVRV